MLIECRRQEDAMPRILIADDNPSNADLLDAHLDGTGFETKLVYNGEEALAAARKAAKKKR